MNAVKVDKTRRIRLKVLRPGDYYEPEFVSAEEITLPGGATKAQAH